MIGDIGLEAPGTTVYISHSRQNSGAAVLPVAARLSTQPESLPTHSATDGG